MSQENLICSFCNKSRKDVTKMIVGASKTSICNECVKLCVEILEEDIVKSYSVYASNTEFENALFESVHSKMYSLEPAKL